jgi:hypothetical protein
LRVFAKEYKNKRLTLRGSLKEYENKGVAKSTFRAPTKEYQTKGLSHSCPYCGVGRGIWGAMSAAVCRKDSELLGAKAIGSDASTAKNIERVPELITLSLFPSDWTVRRMQALHLPTAPRAQRSIPR